MGIVVRRSTAQTASADATRSSDRCYATGMSDAQPPEPQAPVTTADTKALVRTIVGTGIGLATLLLMLIALVFQQNANLNARIDDVHRRIDDVQADIRDLRTEVRADIRELREIVINVLKGETPAD